MDANEEHIVDVIGDSANRYNTKPNEKGLWRCGSYRLGIAFLLLTCLLSLAFMRTDLNMAIVCMVNTTAMHTQTNDSSTAECAISLLVQKEYDGTFEWSHSQQALLFSSAFWGGMFTSLLAGWFADRYGPKNLMLISALVCCVATLLTPTMANHADFIGMFTIRFILGVGEGLMLPCIACVVARWFPPIERSTVIAMFTSGNQLALVLAMPISATLCQNHAILGGWPSIFYLFGLLALIWCTFWYIYGSNSADKNTKMSSEEKEYIQWMLKDQNMQLARKDAMSQIPWCRIFSSVPLWSDMLMNYMAAFTMFTLTTQIPTYFKQILALNLKTNGFYSALPFVFQLISKAIFAVTADFLKRRNVFGHTTICKIFNSIHSFGPLVFMVPLGYVDCHNPYWALFLLCATTSCMSGAIPGWMTSLHTIAPRYSGTITSISRLSGLLGACSGPIYASYLTPNGSQAEWRSVFISVSTLLAVSGLIFNFLGSAELQSWAMVSKTSQVPLVRTEPEHVLAESINDQPN